GAVGLLCAAAAGLAGCGHSQHASSTGAAGASTSGNRLDFAYDTSAPLRYTDRGVVLRRAGIAVHNVSYLSGGRRIEAFLVNGTGKVGKEARPGVVLVHGGGADRTELLGDAVELARRGFVA